MIYGIIVIVCSVLIYGSGVLMNYISDNHKDKEWINGVVACIDLFLLGISFVAILNMICLLLPLALMVVGGVVLLGVLVLILMYIVNKLTNILKK